MKKIQGFDYLWELEKLMFSKYPNITQDLKNTIDGHFFYVSKYYHEIKPDKIKNPRILLQFERGGMENSYINIFLADYDAELHKKQDPELIGFYCVKDYFQEQKKVFEFMYCLQNCIYILSDRLYNE